MLFADLLQKKRNAIVSRWLELTMDSYPGETAKFLKRVSDPFANPVGNALKNCAGSLFDALMSGAREEKLALLLADVVKIRAVQELSASQAVSFVFFLKNALRENLKNDLTQPDHFKELLAWESRIDNLSLLAFDVHMQYRETFWEIKSNELRKRSMRVIERMSSRLEPDVHACGSEIVNDQHVTQGDSK